MQLRELCSFRHGGTPSKSNSAFWGGDIPWVSPKDMKTTLLVGAQDSITLKGVEESATSLVPAGSILTVVRSGILAHSVPFAIAGRPLTFNQDIKAIQVTSDKVTSEYIYWLLRSKEPEILARGVKKGATVHSLQSGFLEKLTVPILPKSHQQRIVDLLARAENIVRMRREAEQKTKEIIPALFLDMFGNPATNPKGWTIALLGDVIEKFRYGSSQKSSGTGHPILRIPNVVGGQINIRDLRFLDVGETDRLRYSLVPGDVLFVRTNGNPDYVGRCAVFDAPDERSWLYASYLIMGRPRMGVAHPKYLQAYLSSSSGRGALRERARTAAGQYNINIEGLRSIPLLLPPLSKQVKFADLYEELSGFRDRQFAASEIATGTFQSLLAEVFAEPR
jgi:type I restriction enzyme S subunit